MKEQSPEKKFYLQVGGMGAYVSNSNLAQAVIKADSDIYACISGTGIGIILPRLLESGNKRMLHALNNVPPAISQMAERVINKYYIEGGKDSSKPYTHIPHPTVDSLTITENQSSELAENTILGAFTEVFLAKERNKGRVGINLLEKIQMLLPFSLYGAMLANVDAIFIGAGIPKDIPKLADRLSHHEEVFYNLNVHGAPTSKYKIGFNPKLVLEKEMTDLSRPACYAIVSAYSLAARLDESRRGEGIEHAFNGFIFEEKDAGGHNMPPRGKKILLDADNEPIYGEKDEIDFSKVRELGTDFIIAGGSWNKIKEIQETGAIAAQLGSILALSSESGYLPKNKELICSLYQAGLLNINTDIKASPAGIPFKVARIPGSIADQKIYSQRQRICDIGHLVELYEIEDGKIGYRCPAEPEEAYLIKGGDKNKSEGCICLCNGLISSVGLGQTRRNSYQEPPLYTLGKDLSFLDSLLKNGRLSYTAAEAIAFIKAQ